MNIDKIIEISNNTNINIIDYNSGRLKHNGQVYDCIAVICDILTDKQISYLNSLKSVIKIGVCGYRYAAEIKYNVIYIKA